MRSTCASLSKPAPQSLNAGPFRCYHPKPMSTLLDELQKQARMLTPQEKASLAHILIQELDPAADSDVEQLWIAESQRRYAAYLRGELKSVSGEDVMLRARSRVK